MHDLGDFAVVFIVCVVVSAIAGLVLLVLLAFQGARSLSDSPPPAPRRALAPQLQPGDCLLYSPKGLFGWIIAIKTWHAVGHCEVYIGNGRSIASRDGIGVGEYPLRSTELRYVMRPNVPFDLAAALAVFNATWRGQGYDYLGLLRFAWRSPVRDRRFDNRQFCSELETRFYRAGNLDPFPWEDADAVVPFQFKHASTFDLHDVDADGNVVRRTEAVRG